MPAPDSRSSDSHPLASGSAGSNADPGAAQLAGTGSGNADVSVSGNRRPTTSAEIPVWLRLWLAALTGAVIGLTLVVMLP